MLDHSVHSTLPSLRVIGNCLIIIWPVLLIWWLYLKLIATKKIPKELPTGPTERLDCPACGKPKEKKSSEPPPRIKQQRGPPRSVDTRNHYCPNKDCRYYGWAVYGNIRSNGHPNGGRWRQLQCVVCDKHFADTTGTIFYHKHAAPKTIWRVLKAMAEGLGIRGTAFECRPGNRACKVILAFHNILV